MRQRLNVIYLFIYFIVVTGCQQYFPVETDINYIHLDTAQVDAQPEVWQTIMPYKKAVDATMNEEIGILITTLRKGQPSSSLGSWVCDIIHDEVKAQHFEDLDFAIQNQGGIRIRELSKGPITIGEIYELMPFENYTTILELTGQEVQVLLNAIAKRGGWPISRQVRFSIEGNKAVDVTIHEKPLQNDKTYTVAMPDYTANGGDIGKIFSDVTRHDLGILIRDVIIDHIKREDTSGIKQDAYDDLRIK